MPVPGISPVPPKCLPEGTSVPVHIGVRTAPNPAKRRGRCVVSAHRRQMCQDIGDTYVKGFSCGYGAVSHRGACVGGSSVSELAAAHGVHRSWIYKLIARYQAGGYEALQPRSRRPRSCKHQTPAEVAEAVLNLREQLQQAGHDAGAARRSPTTSRECWRTGRQHRPSQRSGESSDEKAWSSRNHRSGRTAA